MDYTQIRAEARTLLSGKWWMLALIWLLFWLLESWSGINLIIGGPLSLGISMLFLKIYRGQDFQLEEMFSGFNDFGRSLTAYLLIMLYVLLWSLLFHDLFHHGGRSQYLRHRGHAPEQGNDART